MDNSSSCDSTSCNRATGCAGISFAHDFAKYPDVAPSAPPSLCRSSDWTMLARALPIRAIAVLGFGTFVFGLFAAAAAAALGLS
jgi:hypothetical protein